MEAELGIDQAQARSQRVLEWPLVQKRVLGLCQWCGGQEVLASFAPLDDLDDLHRRQAHVAEALRLEGEGGGRNLGGLVDPRPALEASLRGRRLDPEALLDIELACSISRDVQSQFRGRDRDLPLLFDVVHPVIAYPRLEARIRRAITRDAKVSDEASPALRRLRAQVRELEDKLQRSLQSLLRHPELAKTYQEPIVTQREGRFVIPVKAEYRSRFPGIVVDSSASGATVFMEPFLAVSLGNDLRQQVLAEEREVNRILVELTALVAEHASPLLRATAALARLDAYLALARYAFRCGGFLPQVTWDGDLRLRRAHHPLIDEGSVPIDVELAGKVRTLVVTGPNTGGKTVALKILGLLSLMASSGYPIPASEETTLPLITRVWADIGDEQSLAQSLSTFSAHLVQVLEILKHADEHSLVLLDELGAGTDPSEGGALGVAILGELYRRRARTVVSTHLSVLKVQAKKLEGFDNAAVEFDTATLKPTYRVLMGIPGRSNALAIAAGLGLPENLLREARSFLGGGFQAVEHLLEDLELERRQAQERQARLHKEQQDLEVAQEKLDEARESLEASREQILEDARREAERLIEDTQSKTRAIFKDFQLEMQAASHERREELLRARRLAREWAERTRSDAVAQDSLAHYGTTAVAEDEIAFDVLGAEARTVARKAEAELEVERKALALQRRQERKKLKPDRQRVHPSEPRAATRFFDASFELAVGTRVFSPRLGQEGVVLAQRGGRVDVKLGMLKMSFGREELEVFQDQHVPAAKAPPEIVVDASLKVGVDIMPARLNVRGQTVDVALFELDTYLDRAIRAGLNKIEILHGKGTGTLRQAIQKHLRGHSQVADFRDGGHGEGSWGVTIAQLRS